MKLIFDSEAKILIKAVFPQPGGPYSRMPEGGVMPRVLKDSGCERGQSTSCRSLSLVSWYLDGNKDGDGVCLKKKKRKKKLPSEIGPGSLTACLIHASCGG